MVCSRCHRTLDAEAFPATLRPRRHPVCSACQRRGRGRPRAPRRDKLVGLTPLARSAMELEQHHRCGCCGVQSDRLYMPWGGAPLVCFACRSVLGALSKATPSQTAFLERYLPVAHPPGGVKDVQKRATKRAS